MTLQERGAYIELLLYAWKSDACALPKHEVVLKSLASWPEQDYLDEYGICPHNFQRVLDCFEAHPEHPDMLCNLRLYKEWLAAIERHQTFSKRGKKGAKKRWAESAKNEPQALKLPTRNLADRSGTGFESVGQIADKNFKPR